MAIPYGQYNHVYVTPLPGSVGQLINGTGTSNYSGTVFYCGPFDRNDLPEPGRIYNIRAEINNEVYTFLGQCFNAGQTSDFDVLPL